MQREGLPSHRVTRRKALGLGAGAAAGAVLATAGLGAREARAVSAWVFVAGSSGYISQNWHGDSWFGTTGAVDIDAYGGADVGLYVRIDQTSTYGWFECTSIDFACESWLYPTHRNIRFKFATASGQPWFGQGGFMHVEPYSIQPGDQGRAYRQVAFVGSGEDSAGEYCYTGSHLHQTANGSHLFESPVPSPASAGNNAYWYWWA